MTMFKGSFYNIVDSVFLLTRISGSTIELHATWRWAGTVLGEQVERLKEVETERVARETVLQDTPFLSPLVRER